MERIYLGSFEIYRERITSPSPEVTLERQTLHVLDGVKRIAMVETLTIDDGDPVTTPDPKQRYQLGNHLGSAMLELDETGLVISYEEYAPYGTSAYRSARSGVEVSARRYRYIGMERDDETGLYQMGARYYCAWLGRWTSADPMGIGADGPGLYNYTRGSPIVMSDPSGHDAFAAIASGVRRSTSQALSQGRNAVSFAGTGEAGPGAEPNVPQAAAFRGASGEIDLTPRTVGASGYVDTWAPSEGGVTEFIEPGNLGNATELTPRALSEEQARLDALYAEGDHDALDERGQEVWEQYDNGEWGLRSTIEPPIGTSDVEAYIATGGLFEALGFVGKKGLAAIGRGRAATALEAEAAASETTGALSNLGDSAISKTANTLDEYGQGAAFSGAYDTKSGQFLAYPSGQTVTKTGATPDVLVPRAGGHSMVGRQLSSLTGTPMTESVGFAAQIEADGSLSLTWKSGQLNGRFEGELVPEEMRPGIIEAIAKATGRRVYTR